MTLHIPPKPFDSARAARVKEALAENGFISSEPLLDAVFGNSPFLGRIAIRETGALGEYFAAGPQTVLNAAILLAEAAGRADNEIQVMKDLRVAKRRAALAIAMADIAGTWDVNRVTAELTRFADACVASALRFLLRVAAAQTGVAQAGGAQAGVAEVREEDCGLTVLAMGKYGAFELNYSSDIDLVVFYDAAKFPFAKRGDPRGAAVDIVRGLVKLLSETSRDGYVFRVDLRLRPDAGATQVAISTAPAPAIHRPVRNSLPACGPSSGGAIWISPRSKTSSRSSVRSTPMPVMARSQSRDTISSWGAAASARSNSLPRPSN